MPNIKHAFVSGKTDGVDATLVQPSNWNAEHTIDTYLDYPATTIPAAPVSGLRTFARSRAGRILPHIIGPSGVDVALQPALFGNTVFMWLPGTGTTVAINFGTAFTARNNGTAAAQAHPTKASTNAMTSLSRATFGTGTTATIYGIASA